MKHFTLDCLPFPGVHDAPAICSKVAETLRKYKLHQSEIQKYIGSEIAANMLKALTQGGDEGKELLWIHISCFNHTLQLAITDTKKDLGAVPVIDKVSAHVGRYNRSKNAREDLNHFQKEHKLPEHGLVQNVDTRWDSDFAMLERYEEQKMAVTSEQAKAGVDSLTANEWRLVTGYVESLRSIVLFTAEMGSVQKPTLSMVLPALFEIKSSLREFVRTSKKGTRIMFARSLLAQVESRFPDSDCLRCEMYLIAMLINPKFKDVLVVDDDDVDAAKLLEKAALEKYRQHICRGFKNIITPEKAQDIAEKTGLPEPSQKQKVVKWSHFKKKATARTVSSDEQEACKKEVEIYLSEPTLEVDEDPLEWWRNHKERFPFLTPVARHYLGPAATETPCERVFSVGGNVVTAKRTNLLLEHVKELVFCHDNL